MGTREVAISTEGLSFEGWLKRARLRRERLKAHQISVLEAAFRFLEHGSHDYASRRLVEHFLMHAELGLKVAQVARLVGLDRCSFDDSASSSPPEAAPSAPEHIPTTDIRVLTPSAGHLILPPPAHFFSPTRSTPVPS